MKFIYVRAEATTTEHGPRDLTSFAHCFVEAESEEAAYLAGGAALAVERPLMPKYYMINDYVVALPPETDRPPTHRGASFGG